MPPTLPLCVNVQYTGIYEPNMTVLKESLIPFGRWSEDNIAYGMPVTVHYPDAISDRLNTLKSRLKSGNWPRDTPSDAINHFRMLIDQVMPRVDIEIAKGVRLMAAAAIRDDGSRAVDIRDQVLSIFLASKMLATARILRGLILRGEEPLEWGPEFCEMLHVWSPRLIYGLVFISRNFHNWAGWTDADLILGDDRYRVYVPICPEPEHEFINRSLSGKDVLHVILPQLLEADTSKALSYLLIQKLVFDPSSCLARDLIPRYESFVDVETCTDHSHAKEYIERIAADRIASCLQQMPASQRRSAFFKMTILAPCFNSLGVAERVKEKMQFD